MTLQTDLSSFSYKKGSLVPVCKRCGAENFYRNGRNKAGIQRYRCKKCNFRFVWTSDMPRRKNFSHIIGFAVELYTSLGMAASLRGVATVLKKVFDISVSHEIIRLWVLTSNCEILPRKEIISTTWHADETYFKIQGVGHWLWIVYCANTKQILSWCISKKRLFKHAKKLFQEARRIAQIRPVEIITDGLYQYAAAIKKTMGWHWRVYRKRHIIDSGIGKML